MRIKIAFGFLFFCLLVCLGVVVSNSSTAQSPSPMISGWPFSVNFVEDPYRKHGMEIQGFYLDKVNNVTNPVFTVPSGKRYVVTDVLVGTDAVPFPDLRISLASNGQYIAAANLNANKTMIRFQSGVIVEENRTLELSASYVSHVTISGYFVDM